TLATVFSQISYVKFVQHPIAVNRINGALRRNFKTLASTRYVVCGIVVHALTCRFHPSVLFILNWTMLSRVSVPLSSSHQHRAAVKLCRESLDAMAQYSDGAIGVAPIRSIRLNQLSYVTGARSAA